MNLSALGTAATDPTSLPGLLLAAASNKTVRLPNGQEVPAYTVAADGARERERRRTCCRRRTWSPPTTRRPRSSSAATCRSSPAAPPASSNLSNLFTTIERHDVGITLRLTPQITADDFVHLTLFEEVSDIDPIPSPAIGDPNLVGPTTTIRSASTVVGARDGQTVVIGGLLADTVRADERGVPFLKDVPVLGNLFRRDDDRRVKTNLLVFLTPHVIATDAADGGELAPRARPHAARASGAARLLRDRPVGAASREAPEG